MRNAVLFISLFIAVLTVKSQNLKTANNFESDSFDTSKGKLTITFIGHASLVIKAGATIIYIDPVLQQSDYQVQPKGDLILLTHGHADHFDIQAVDLLTKPTTKIIASLVCKDRITSADIMMNGESRTIGDLTIKAVPAYNIVNCKAGIPYHLKGDGNGYVIGYGGKNIYVSGDTELIPEMEKLVNIDIAFLPILLPYTMTPQMAAEAVKVIKPKIFYPYHTGTTDPQLMVSLLKDNQIEVRVRRMK